MARNFFYVIIKCVLSSKENNSCEFCHFLEATLSIGGSRGVVCGGCTPPLKNQAKKINQSIKRKKKEEKEREFERDTCSIQSSAIYDKSSNDYLSALRELEITNSSYTYKLTMYSA
jgi:chorismate synthase